jgi:hypothetical protein
MGAAFYVEPVVGTDSRISVCNFCRSAGSRTVEAIRVRGGHTTRNLLDTGGCGASYCFASSRRFGRSKAMTVATTSSTARRSLLHHVPELALALAGTAVVLLALGPIG